MRRLLVLVIASLALLLAGAAMPAQAATKAAGIPDLTPYGGYLGNYLAPDGSVGYCIDSPLPWPSGDTSSATLVDAVSTTWGAPLQPDQLRKLNYVLATYGQTSDPVQAAAVAAFVNAYTSGWARDLGAGYAAGAWYLNGDATVTAVYDTIWADAEANAIPTLTASLALEMSDPVTGVLAVTASRPDATGTVTLTNAVRADTAEATFAVTAGESIAVRGIPVDGQPEYEVGASADLTAGSAADPAVFLYETQGQQRLIRAGTSTPLATAARAAASVPVPPMLAATGSAGDDAGAVGLALVGLGTLLVVSRHRGGNTERKRAL